MPGAGKLTRRQVLQTALAADFGLAVCGRGAKTKREESVMAKSGRNSSKPNVLVFFTDQQRWDTAGCYGNPMGLTPNLDFWAKRSVLFRHAFTCQPVCAPARASLQTGKYATAVGVWRNGLALNPAEKTLAHHFKAAGYRVGYIGKWHLANTGNKPVPKELRGGYTDLWEAADVLEHLSHPYAPKLYDSENRLMELSGYRVDALTERAVSFISSSGREPFFLFLSFLEPHFQNDMNAYVAPNGYAERFSNPWVPPDLLGKPGDWYKSLPDYYGCVARLDECLGRIMQCLEETGAADNTIVLFTSDHGCHFRTRNSEYKRSCHEASIRIPAVMWGPGLGPRVVVDELVSLVDLTATLLDAAGLEVPGDMHGRSALPLLSGPVEDWPEEVFVQISEAEVGRAIRTERWKYAVFAPDRDGWRDPNSDVYVERYLYDLFADPYEQVNLVGRPEYRKVADELRERLLKRIQQAGESPPRIEPARYPA